ncbi:MAG: tetratricopeptide repeat protein [Desulfobacterota bacterium]|nr:tetratricopeptide repeat protein [Thermodesulfobacteriota bacterium]
MGIPRLKRYEKLFEALKARVAENPDYPDLRHQLALFHFAQGDPEGAERELLEALRLNPKYQEAALHLGCLYLEQGRWEEARSVTRSIARKRSKTPLFREILGQMAQGGRPKSEADRASPPEKGQRLRDVKPHLRRLRGQFHLLVAILLAREGRLGQALKDLEKAAEWIPPTSQFYYYKGMIYYHSGDYRRGIAEFKKALSLDPHHGMAHAHLGELYGLTGRISEAIRHLERAVALHPRYADLHYQLGLLYSGQRRYPEAIAQLKRALRLNPNYLFARINLGDLYEKTGRWKKAQQAYERVLQLTPEDEHVKRRLERILEKRG